MHALVNFKKNELDSKFQDSMWLIKFADSLKNKSHAFYDKNNIIETS